MNDIHLMNMMMPHASAPLQAYFTQFVKEHMEDKKAILPKRKQIRIDNYDYSTPGAYFITVCVKNRNPIFWSVGAATCRPNFNGTPNVGAATCRPNRSKIGIVVETAILQIPKHYPMISVDKYCVMPDHIHMILSINTDEDGRQIAAPTISTVIGHMKR